MSNVLLRVIVGNLS